MNTKQKHDIFMWVSDFIGGVLGGMIVMMFFGIVIYYGFGGGELFCQ